MGNWDILIIAGTIVMALLAIGMILSRLYTRASKEVSFVRTGFGGQKVIINGGAIVLPVLHEVIPVNMNTLRLEVNRANEAALITQDRMRVDVTAEFYVRAKPTSDSIANAAQTLGHKTMVPEQLKGLVEGKFVDALRAVAAEMDMEELHEKRVDFVQKVQQVVSEDLLKNGLELESVSLTGLDQTSVEHFNPQNVFDAEGLTKLTEAIETRRKIRNDIEQDNMVAIQQKNLEAERTKLEIKKEEEYARLEQQREIEVRRASQSAEIVSEQAAKKREAEEATIEAQRKVDMANIVAERTVEEERIQKSRAVETAEIERQKSVELTEQGRAIAIAEKSRSQSEARAEADRALAVAVREEEAVKTVREVEQAERVKQVELVEARQVAEKQAITVTVAAEAEKVASEDQADAVKTLAMAEGDKERITANAAAEAELARANAAERTYAVNAEGERAMNTAANLISDEQIAMQVRLALIEHLPEIIRESVKPMEQIDGIKIIQVDGLNSGSSSGSDEAGNSGSLADQLVGSALRYRAQSPLVDSLLSEIGLQGGDLNGLTNVLKPDNESGNG
ncbi:MAG: flotillin family protein [Immundisolibacteraceae bacterium]|nr:flotillin family protein [Immundisolibacteraceae bacterium]